MNSIKLRFLYRPNIFRMNSIRSIRAHQVLLINVVRDSDLLGGSQRGLLLRAELEKREYPVELADYSYLRA